MLGRYSSEIRTVCANERPSGSVRGAISNGCPYGDLSRRLPGFGGGFSSSQGYWLNGTKGNTVSENGAYYNTIAGFYLGCNSKGNVNPLIPCTTTTTTGNSLQANGAYGEVSTSYAQKYGLAVERESIDNTFIENYLYDDSAYRNKVDIIDGNGNCVYNTYLDDTYGTKSPKCIQ